MRAPEPLPPLKIEAINKKKIRILCGNYIFVKMIECFQYAWMESMNLKEQWDEANAVDTVSEPIDNFEKRKSAKLLGKQNKEKSIFFNLFTLKEFIFYSRFSYEIFTPLPQIQNYHLFW